ncbi:MAG: FAD-dependent oxidoreductase [Proteobacteria bacterium]|nr:FAD-dependent oxidoreductase [Pseudomonadota bacterium]
MKNNEYDVIVVGSGASGCTVAREMTRKGKKVLLIEKGGRAEWLGNTITVARMIDIPTLLRNYKDIVIFVNNYGGASNISAGSALPPPDKIFGPLGIDLSTETEEARKEMGVNPLPDELIGENNLRLMDAANSLGYHWRKMDKFIDASKCTGSGNCMLGCKTGAKWTGRVFGDEAIKGGADLMLHTSVKSLIIENGKAIGVETTKKDRFYGKQIVLSAGGLTNVHLLRGAGITDAGKGLACDWLSFVQAVVPGTRTIGSTPMSVGTLEHYDDDGIVILPVGPNWALFLGIAALSGPSHLLKFRNFFKYSSIMVKIQDDLTGTIGKGRAFKKPMTENDRKKIDKGVQIVTQIFKKAGAKESTVYPMKPAGAHPSATCRIGQVIDNNLATQIKNLFVCDASVFPQALGAPVVWTVVSLGKRLAKHLDTVVSG